MTVVLMLPAVVVTLSCAVIWFGIARDPVRGEGGLDLGGLALISLVIGLVMGGLIADAGCRDRVVLWAGC